MEALPACTGLGADGDHCCYQGNERCPHLVEDAAGRKFACGLFVKYGSWEDMNRSVDYQPIGDYWLSRGLPFNYCQSFNPIFCCRPELRLGIRNHNEPAYVRRFGRLEG